MAKERKQRDILKLLYDENLEMERFKVYVKKYIREQGCSKIPVSIKANKEYSIPFESLLNTICGYLEELKTLKDGKA